MSNSEKTSETKKRRTRKSYARIPEEQERHMINLAIRQAESMLEEGRAPTQVVVHYLKLATENTRLANERLRATIDFLKSKNEAVQDARKSNELYEEVIRAFKSYGGGTSIGPDQDFDEEDYY